MGIHRIPSVNYDRIPTRPVVLTPTYINNPSAERAERAASSAALKFARLQKAGKATVEIAQLAAFEVGSSLNLM